MFFFSKTNFRNMTPFSGRKYWLDISCPFMLPLNFSGQNPPIMFFFRKMKRSYHRKSMLKNFRKIIFKDSVLGIRSKVLIADILTDAGEDSKLVHRRIWPKCPTLFSSLFFNGSERRVWLSAEPKIQCPICPFLASIG